MDKELALITGASSGIGLELAKIMASDHINLILTARSTNALNQIKEDLVKEFGVEVWVHSKDLSIADSASELYEFLEDNGLKPTILANNAGFGDFGFFHESDWDKVEMMMNLNMLTLTHLTRLIGADMVKQKHGKILNIASTAAFQPGPLMSVYYATKAYVLSFSEGIANEWKDFGVSVTAFCPGATDSNFAKAADASESKLFKNKKLPSSKEVAKCGYQAMLNGEVVSIHGLLNTALATSIRFTPRGIIRKIVRNLQEKSA